MNTLKIACCQMNVVENKQVNIDKAREMISTAASLGAKIITLPEIFNCPYDNKYFRDYAETFKDGETIAMLASSAKKHKIFLVGGSIPELDNNKVYNTSFVFNDEGKLIGKHRKVHLFDIDIKDKIRFKESEVLSYGESFTVMDTPYVRIGVAICYDIRFPEQIRIMALKGAKLILVPAAFNTTTGPAHWDILFRTRALDNQVYIAATSPARNLKSSYVAYGYSLVADPYGKIINQLDEKEGILISNLDLDYIDKIREELPLLKHRRTDLYELVSKKD